MLSNCSAPSPTETARGGGAIAEGGVQAQSIVAPPQPLTEALWLASVVMLIAWLALGLAYRGFRAAQIEAVQSELLQLARTATALVDGEAHRAIERAEATGSAAHLKQLAPLVEFHRRTRDVIYVYTAVARGDDVRFVLDTAYLYAYDGHKEPPEPLMAKYPGKDPELRRAAREGIALVNPGLVVEAQRTYMSAFAPFFDRSGAFVGVVGIDMWVRDLEARLQRGLNATLWAGAASAVLAALLGIGTWRLRRAALVAERARAQALAAALAAREAADRHAAEVEAAKRSQGVFFATISHELRTPLHGVLGMAQMLEISDLDAEQREGVELILSSGRLLLDALNEMLDYAQVDAGLVEFHRQPFVPSDVVGECVQLLAPQAAAKGLRLSFEPGNDTSRPVLGDASRLKQIVLNLLANAIKFTTQGEVRLRLWREAEQDQLGISVVDTGIGIPADRLGRLFQPFAQADVSVSRAHGGTGLGLALSRRLAQMMGGELRIDSEVGKGTQCICTLRVPLAAD